MTAIALPFRRFRLFQSLRQARPQGGDEPRLVIARHMTWSALRWAVIWGTIIGLFVVSNVKAYVAGYPTLAQRQQVSQSLKSFEVLLGPAYHTETVPGFVMWRVGTAAALMGGIWALRASTGRMRGDEDEGRWEMLLTGRTTRRRAAAEALLGMGVALLAMFAATALLTLAASTLPGAHMSPQRSLLFSINLVAGAAMFMAIGAVTSQLAANRGQASSLAVAAFGVSYAVRMVADSSRSLGWLRWLSPLGWLEELRPLRDPQPVALLPMAGLVAGCAALTVYLAGRRDLNGSILREGTGTRRDVRWLRGPLTLALRLARGGAISWLVGVAALSWVEGAVARSAAGILTASPAFASALRKMGVRQGAQGYLGAAFLFVALLIAVMAASQIGGIRDEEASGRLDNLLVRPVRRARWFLERVGVSLALLAGAGLVSGVVTWAAAASQHTGVPLAKLVEAGLNATAPGVFVLGAGAMMIGVLPRAAPILSYGIVAYSFLVTLVGAVIKGQDWIRDTSLMAHIALAPGVKPDWFQASMLVLLGLGMAGLGAIMLGRRDVAYA